MPPLVHDVAKMLQTATRRYVLLPLLVVLLATPVTVAAQMTVVSRADARFQPVDPARPGGAAIAVLRGDPAAGPSTMLMRMPRGGGVMHEHTAAYDLVVLEGTMKHWPEGQSEADAAALGAGSYWHQPGGAAHADACLTDTCLMFITWSGARDARAVQMPGASAGPSAAQAFASLQDVQMFRKSALHTPTSSGGRPRSRLRRETRRLMSRLQAEDPLEVEGSTLWFIRKRLPGSYLAFSSLRRL